MDLCLYHKLRWLNSTSIHPVLHAKNLGVIMDTCLFLHSSLLYITSLIDPTFKNGSWFPPVLFISAVSVSDPDLGLDHLTHGSLKLLPNYTSSCLRWSLQSIPDSNSRSVFKNSNLTTWLLCLNVLSELPLVLEQNP